MSKKWIYVSMLAVAFLAGGCSVTNQVNADMQFSQLVTGDTTLLGQDGIGVLTPSAPTGQESDKQALADALGVILERDVAEGRIVSLPALLSAVNQAGLARSYSNMFDEYDRTGILERDTLRAIGDAAGTRYVAKLNLGNFQQQTSGRARILGVRFLDTRTASIRVHLEIWDTDTGGIVWQGNEELTFAQERVREQPVTFQQVAAMAAERLVSKLGESGSESVEEMANVSRRRAQPATQSAPAVPAIETAAASTRAIPVSCDSRGSVAAVSVAAAAVEPAALRIDC